MGYGQTIRGVLALMGSGELTATMVEVHKGLLGRLGPSARAVFLDTPAGFQLNVDQIAGRAAEYFRSRVGRPMEIACLHAAADLETLRGQEALQRLRGADYVLMGPGSPTYAVRQWKGTPVPDILAERIAAGGCVVAASAAALTVGRWTLPVYEIYKVGEEPRWVEGIDLLGRFGYRVAVVPHWNNAEGGTHDTRFCYMGEPRFRILEARLPPDVTVLGIDEHTACVLDFGAGTAAVTGIGRVTLRRQGAEAVFQKGDRFDLEQLGNPRGGSAGRASEPAPEAPQLAEGPGDPLWSAVHAQERAFQAALDARDPRGAARALLEVDRLVWGALRDGVDEGTVAQVREGLREMVVLLAAALDAGPRRAEEAVRAVVEPLLAWRTRLREEGRWAEADALRRCLEQGGIRVEDTRQRSRWRFADEGQGRAEGLPHPREPGR
ncbi:MAG: hypothetical protein Kow0092_28060 [Deferrisomatales bacterium]